MEEVAYAYFEGRVPNRSERLAIVQNGPGLSRFCIGGDSGGEGLSVLLIDIGSSLRRLWHHVRLRSDRLVA